MGPLFNFIIENSASITSLTIIIITLLVVLNLFGITLNKDMDSDLNKIVTIEALINKNELPNLSFTQDNFKIDDSNTNKLTAISFNKNSYCTNNLSNPDKIDRFCRLHESKDLCDTNSCCGWLNKIKCVGGYKDGPIFHGTEHKPLNIEYYDYMGKTIEPPSDNN